VPVPEVHKVGHHLWGIASIWLPCCRVGMQPELVLGEEEKKERFKVSLNRRNHDELIDDPMYTDASEASTSHTSERPGIVVAIPTTIVAQDMVARVSSNPSTSSVTLNTTPDMTEEEKLVNATSHNSTISFSSIQNVSENVMNIARSDVITDTKTKPDIAEEEKRINAYNHEFNLSVSRIENASKKEKNKYNVANRDACASTSAAVVKRVSVIRLVSRIHGNDTKEAEDGMSTEINDEKLYTERGNQIRIAEKGKLDTELGENSSLKTEVSCPESQIILKYIHKKFGKRKHYIDSETKSPSQGLRPESGNR
jgi:hypothetical protein